MPAIGDLEGAGERLTRRERKATAAVSRDDSDPRLSGEPCLRRRRLSVQQEFDRTMALEVANDRPIALISYSGPVVNPHRGSGQDGRRRSRDPLQF
jgi:hypothetical protein